MGAYIARRLILMIPTLIGITFLVFMIVALAPGGIGASLKVSGGNLQSQSSVAVLQAYLEDRYGLDDPVVVQYVRWLGRISPIKFGPRDQVAPSGERLRPPKEIKPPPLWRFFAAELPVPAELAPASGAREERVAAHREATVAFAGARARAIETRTLLEQRLIEYAQETKIPGAVTGDGKLVPAAFDGPPPRMSTGQWERVSKAGIAAVEAYRAAIDARARLRAAFDARPYPQSGLPLIPGAISLDLPDLGIAYSRQRPVGDLIARALPVTLMINLIAFPIIYMVAIPGGMLAATRRGSIVDTGLGAMFIGLWSIPGVLAGVFALGFLASPDYLAAFPVSGLHDNNAADFRFLPFTDSAGAFHRGYLLDTVWHLCLPVLCLTYAGFAILSKQCRAAMLDNFSADYVRTAKAKGVSGRDVVLRHVFRNSLLPLITMFVTIFPAMLAGSVVVEKIFTIPGMGSLILEAISLRDRELILANTLMIAGVNLVALLLADVLYALADPRVSYA
ncbi:MAG: ABC transporter permease [Phycisphaerales bacterium]